jgi:hypothetical protein
VANLNLTRRPAYRAGGVGKKELFLVGAHQAEEGAGLGVVILVCAMIPVIGGAFEAEGRFGKILLLPPFTVTVGLVAEGTPMVAVDPHDTVAVIAVDWAPRSIDRDQVVVYAEPVTLGIAVGKQPPPWSILSGEKPIPGTMLAGLKADCSTSAK